MVDQAAVIRHEAARTWNEYTRQGDVLRGQPGALPLRAMLEMLAETVFQLTVIEDDTLCDTNIEGELNREDGLILLRPGLNHDRANFVLAHEIGHFALNHPLQRIVDTNEQIDTETTPDDLSAERQQRLTGLDLPADAALTALRGYSPRDIYEMQANAFATELLVPGEHLRAAFQAQPDRLVSSVARELGVPDNLIYVGMTQALFGPVVTLPSQEKVTAFQLDADQEAAVNCPTPALIIAGPGAGKTRVLVSRFARLVAEGTSPRQILALTFANKAAGEMRERLVPLVGEEHAGSLEISTFHAFGLQLLQQYGSRIGLKLPLRLITRMDALLMFRRRAAQMAMGALDDLNKSLEQLGKMLDAVSRSKEENADPDRWQELLDTWQRENPDAEVSSVLRDGVTFYREYQKMLKRNGLVDYGDLQTEALRLFSLPEVAAEIRARYTAILVDEFQDINYVSGQLVRALDGGRGVVWVVGDPRQQIYGFRGASPVNLSRFRTADYYPTAQVINLTTNYRSVPDIVMAGSAVPIPEPADAALLPPGLRAHQAASATPAVSSVSLPHGDEEMRWLAEEIKQLHSEGTPLADIAILTRKNRHAAQVAKGLTAKGIAHRWGGPIQERPVFRVLYSALLLAADDTMGVVGLTTLSPGCNLTPDFSLSEQDRRLLLAEGRGRWKARRLLSHAVQGKIPGLSAAGRVACQQLEEMATVLLPTVRPHHNLCVYLFEKARWLRQLLPAQAQEQHEVRATLATVGQMIDLAANFAAQREALARTAAKSRDEEVEDEESIPLDTETSTSAFVAYIQAALSSGELGVPNELNCGGDAVSLITVHRSKGLEWPIVFVPFCVDGQFPSSERASDIPLPPGIIASDDPDSVSSHQREEACLFYVAVTRARKQLYLSSADVYGVRTKGGASGFLTTVTTQLQESGRLDARIIKLPPAPATPTDREDISQRAPYALTTEIHESALDVYEECPRKFLFREIYGLPDGDIAYLRFYRAVYGAIETTSGDAELLSGEFEKRWEKDGPSDDHWQTPLFRKNAERLVQQVQRQTLAGGKSKYRQQKRCALGKLEDGSVYSLCFTLDEDTVKQDGKRFWRRHKTGTHLPKNPPDESRATLYAIHAAQEDESIQVVYHYPQLGQDMPVSIGERKMANFKTKRLQMISDIKAGKMGINPNQQHCKRCAYNLICDH